MDRRCGGCGPLTDLTTEEAETLVQRCADTAYSWPDASVTAVQQSALLVWFERGGDGHFLEVVTNSMSAVMLPEYAQEDQQSDEVPEESPGIVTRDELIELTTRLLSDSQIWAGVTTSVAHPGMINGVLITMASGNQGTILVGVA